METKVLDLHQDKSCFIIIGSKKVTKEIHKEIEMFPLTLYGKNMKEKCSEKYLGDFIHQDGVAQSVEATVNDRWGRLIHGIKEIKAIIEDCRSLTLGGLKVGLDIWESAYIPSLLNNSSTWMEIKESTVNKLEDIQNSLYRNLLDVPYTTPKASLIWEVGGMQMKYRIMKSKLLFMNHILHLDNNSLASQIQKAQLTNDVPGLTQEVQKMIVDLGLPNCFSEKISKTQWKTMVKKAIAAANEQDVRNSLKKYKKVKCHNFDEEKFGCKAYLSNLSLEKARTLFKHKYSMTENVQMNYKGDKKFATNLWKCISCLNQDTESHLLWCPEYSNLREGINLENDSDLCVYLQKIFSLRSQTKR